MRSLCLSLVLGLTPLLLGVAPSEAIAQQAQEMMSPLGTVSSPAYRMSYGGSDMDAMPSGGYSPYQTPYGGYGYSPYQMSYGGSSYRPYQLLGADDIEVSGPLNTPPPHRAIIRLRLPRTWAEVAFDGRKVDSMGQTRTYVTPELSGARTFEVAATWQNNGRATLVQEQVTVNSGQIRTLDFASGN